MENLNDRDSQASTSVRPLLVTLICWLAIAVLAISCYRPTPPSSTESNSEFSARRAQEQLSTLVGNNLPHPAGSAENARVRESIVARMEELGYSVSLQEGTGKVHPNVKKRSPDRDDISLVNIIAGNNLAPTDRKKLLVVAHYDSVPTGPGASDNGVGVASLLEVASILSNKSLKRDVVFLFPDGEEMGLLGAKLFMDQHPLADQIGMVINLDCRGTTGPSLMFETSESTRKLIPIFNEASPRPYASSLFYEVYKYLPNDTDFSVFKRAGIEGFNFAFIGRVENYHTPADNLENVDLGSLQHHGQHVLGLILAIEESDSADAFFDSSKSSDQVPSRVVYFDFMGRKLFWWPEWMAKLTAILSLIGVVLLIVRWPTTQATIELKYLEAIGYPSFSKAMLQIPWSLIKTLIGLFLAGAIVAGMLQLMAADEALSNPWPQNPFAISISLWSVAIAGIIALSLLTEGEPRIEAGLSEPPWTAFGWLITWLGLTCLTSFYVAGASHLFQIPLAIAIVVAALGRWRIINLVRNQGSPSATMGWMFTAVAIGAGLMWLPLEPLLYDALGFKLGTAVAFRVAFVGTSLMPLLSLTPRRGRIFISIILIGIAVVALLWAKFV